jgi:hypothetical protein
MTREGTGCAPHLAVSDGHVRPSRRRAPGVSLGPCMSRPGGGRTSACRRHPTAGAAAGHPRRWASDSAPAKDQSVHLGRLASPALRLTHRRCPQPRPLRGECGRNLPASCMEVAEEELSAARGAGRRGSCRVERCATPLGVPARHGAPSQGRGGPSHGGELRPRAAGRAQQPGGERIRGPGAGSRARILVRGRGLELPSATIRAIPPGPVSRPGARPARRLLATSVGITKES